MEKSRPFNPDVRQSNPLERTVSPAENIRSFLAKEREKLAKEFAERQKDIPERERLKIASDFRIEPPPELYLQAQREYVEQQLRKNHGSSRPEDVAKDENNKAGFMFEMLKTAIMHKKIGKRFIVVRSSNYDDNKNHVDNVLVDRDTGYTVCALDEVSPRTMNDDEMIKKKAELKARNMGVFAESKGFNAPRQTEVEHGVRLKYGVDFDVSSGKISCKEINNLPIFLLSLDHDHLNRVLAEFKNDDTSSDDENRLFEYFKRRLLDQISELKKEYQNLPPEMRSRIDSFESFLQGKK